MKSFVVLSILFSISTVFAADNSWYVIEKFNCAISNGVSVHYTSQRANEVVAKMGLFSKRFYAEKFSYSASANLTNLNFTGRAPTAGATKNPFETAYSIRIPGFLPVENTDSVVGRVYTNVGSTGWVLLPYTATCDIEVQRIF